MVLGKLGVAVKLIALVPLVVNVRLCAAGAVVPVWNANESCCGETFSAAGGGIFTVTGTTRPVVPGALMAMAPKKMPVPRLEGFTLTLKNAGVAPELGFTESQEPLSLVEGVAVTAVVPPMVKNASNDCVCGTVLPEGNVKIRGFGVALNGDAPVLLTFTTTGTVTELLPDFTVTNPAKDPDVSDPGLTLTTST